MKFDYDGVEFVAEFVAIEDGILHFTEEDEGAGCVPLCQVGMVLFGDEVEREMYRQARLADRIRGMAQIPFTLS